MLNKLEIAFWIRAIFDLESNPYFVDLESRFVELKERGFNCIRLESGAGLCHGLEDPSWYEFPDRLKRVNEVFRGART